MSLNAKFKAVALPCHLMVAVVVMISGCVAGNAVTTDQEAEVAIVLPVAADYPVPEVSDFNIDLTLTNELIDTQLMAQETLPQVTFTVWGFDELAADVSATKISVSEFDLRPQAVPYFLRFSEAELQQIEYQSGQTDSLKFYVTMGVDVDGDGSICNGDFRQDYSLSRPERFPVTQAQVTGAIAVGEISGEICAE